MSIHRSLARSIFTGINITTKIIFINVVIFILAWIFSLYIPNFLDYTALQPSLVLQGKNLWTLITSMFMHAGIAHLFFNMFSLYFIGSFVESIVGRKRFVVFYLISGIIGGIFFVILAGFLGTGAGASIFGSPDIQGVGASGAIFGLLGLLAVLTPKNRVYLIVGPLIAIIIQAILENFNASLSSVLGFIVNIYFIISIIAIFSFSSRIRRIALPLEMPFWILPVIAIVPLVIIGLFVPLPIGNTAHFGGLVAGLIYGLYLRRKYPKKIAFLNKVFR